MRCAACQTELLPGKQFCHACGARVGRSCASCGHAIEPGFRFCPECGTPADGPSTSAAPTEPPTAPAPAIPATLAAKIRASQGAVRGERKLVTVMFCDLVGSTAIAERLDPEEYRDLLEQYIAIVSREVHRVEGIITQLAGDGVMALFGAPVAHEDAPYRGVYAALAVRDALADLDARLAQGNGIELRARIGLHTGPVVVGAVGSDLKMTYQALGDTTVLAQRLESAAAPGTILISEATERMIRGFFEVEPVERRTRDGKHEALAAFEVGGLAAGATPMAIAEARGLTPLVGRREELAQMLACFDRLAASFAQVVTVVGDAGSGKSRLVHELKLRLGDVPLTVFEARCSAMTQTVPYAPWVAMMRQHFGLAAGDHPIEAWGKIADRLGIAAEEVATEYPGLAHVLGLAPHAGAGAESVVGDELKRRDFHAVARVVDRAGAESPVVMIIEDVHWMDEPSREMLAAAVVKTSRSRLMIVVTHRSDHQPTWRVKQAFTQLALGPLSDEETIDVVRAVAGGALPPELETRLVRKAEGNPFFAEEMTRTLVEEGYLLRGDDHVRVTRPVDEIRMPGTVEDLIGARLDRLGPQAKRVAQVASVLGRQFHRDQLVPLLAGEDVDVAAALAELDERGVLQRVGASAGELRFAERLTQEVAYEGLLLRQRRALHTRVGQMLDAFPGEPTAERAALLAHHYARSDDRTRAVAALLTAAHEAERVPSFRAAAGYYRDAFEMADGMLQAGPTVDAEVARRTLQAASGLCRMAVIYGVAGLDEAERVGRRARQIAEQLDDTEAFVDLCSLQGTLAMASRDRATFDAGFAIVEEALGVARRDGLVVPTARALRALATGHFYDGRIELAEREIDAAMAELARVDDPARPSDLALGAQVMRARLAYYRDDPADMLDRAATTYDTAVRVGNRTLQSASAASIAQAHFVRGEYEAARHWVEQSLEVALAIGNVGATRAAAAIGVLVCLEIGASDPVPRYLELLEYAPTLNLEPIGTALVVEALVAAGAVAQAEPYADAAYASAGGRLREASAALAFGALRARGGVARAGEAHEWYQRALRLADEFGTRSLAAAAMLGLGELALAREETAAGVERCEEARDLYRRIGFAHYVGRAEQLIAAGSAEVQRSA